MRRIVLLPLLAACTATSDLTEHVSIQDVGSQLDVIVGFTIGEFGDEGVHDVDSVLATFRGDDHDLPCNDHVCSNTIDVGSPLMPDESLAVTVHRGGDTLVSMINIPARIEIQPTPLFVSRAQDLTVTWSPATADNMNWSFDSECVDQEQGTIAPGLTTLTIPAGTLHMRDTRTVCTSSVTLTRYREVPAADGFAGGHVGFLTTSVTTFASTP
jgi:hypothetical protein